MKKGTKCAIAAAVALVLAVAWVWRYLSLNQLFRENYLPFYVEYAIGEEIPYEDNRMVYTDNSDGYTITVQGREILAFEAYAAKYGFAPSVYEERFGKGTTPDAVVEVTVEIKNVGDSSGDNCVPLQEFTVHGETWSFSLIGSGTLFLTSNPGWDPTALTVQMGLGESVTLKLPFGICATAELMPENTWNQFETTDMRLLVTNYPKHIDVRLNG